MKKARFYRKPINIDDIRPRTDDEVRAMLSTILPDEKPGDKQFQKLLKMATGQPTLKRYKIVATETLDPKTYDIVASNLASHHPWINKHKESMFEQNGIVNCIAITCAEREFAILINSEGTSYGR